MPIEMPASDSTDDRLARIADLIGDNGSLRYPETAARVLHALYGYRHALDTGARCDSPTVDGGCARYPDHRSGHSTYPLPGDPGYDGNPAAVAVAQMRDEAAAVIEQLTGEPPREVVPPDPDHAKLVAWARNQLHTEEQQADQESCGEHDRDALHDVLTELERIATRSSDPDARMHARGAMVSFASIWLDDECLDKKTVEWGIDPDGNLRKSTSEANTVD